MLILTRKKQQSIIINDSIVLTVLAVDGDRVKIGITAPADVTILREEVQRAVSDENRRAVATTAAGEAELLLRALRAQPVGYEV
jgi:carbon storage regulator